MDAAPDPFQDRLERALGDAYHVVRELGGGGMSRVFLATEVAFGRNVVIKVLPPDLAADVNRERFRREVHLAAGLQHPMIVPLHSAGEADGLIWYSMPFVDGQSLRERLVGGAIPALEALPILVDVARALGAAHRKGIVHRDIKPGNILLHEQHAVVADFGIAKALTVSVAETNASLGLTGTGFALGTPTYMAPEQAAGDETVDARADIYSLGCVAYEMLSGRTPFTEGSAPRMLIAHATQVPIPLESVAKVSPGLSALIMRCLEKDPALRWHTADALADALEPMRFSADRMSSPSVKYVAPSAPARGSASVAKSSKARYVLGGAALAIVVASGVMLSGKRSVRAADSETLGQDGLHPLAAANFVPPKTIIVADAENRTADSTLGDLLTEALLTELRESRIVTVMTPAATSAALRRMQQPAVARLSASLARDIALREAVPVVVESRIQKIGSTYLVRAALVSTTDRVEQGVAQETAPNDDALIAAIGRLARRTRERLGESSVTLDALAPMEQLTTTSLDALRKYSEANRATKSVVNDFSAYPRAIALLESALKIDSTFAMAWRQLGLLLIEFEYPYHDARSKLALSRAHALRERLSPIERALTDASYFAYVEHDRRRAAEAYEDALREQPGNRAALLFAETLAYEQGQFESMRAYAARRVAVDSGDVTSWRALVWGEYGSGRAREASLVRAVMRSRFSSGPDSSWVNQVDLDFFAHQREWPQVEALCRRLLASPRDPSRQLILRSWLSEALAARGHLEAWWRIHDSTGAAFLAGPDTAERRIWRGTAARTRYRDRAWYGGDTVGIGEGVRTYIAESGIAQWKIFDRLDDDVFLDFELAGDARGARAAYIATRDEAERQKGRGDWVQLRVGSSFFTSRLARVLLLEGKPREALPLLKATAPDELPYPVDESFYVGVAYLALARPDSAKLWFSKVTQLSQDPRRAWWIDSRFRPRALQYLCELAETASQKQQWCGALASEWKDADPILQPVVARARQRMAE